MALWRLVTVLIGVVCLLWIAHYLGVDLSGVQDVLAELGIPTVGE